MIAITNLDDKGNINSITLFPPGKKGKEASRENAHKLIEHHHQIDEDNENALSLENCKKQFDKKGSWYGFECSVIRTETKFGEISGDFGCQHELDMHNEPTYVTPNKKSEKNDDDSIILGRNLPLKSRLYLAEICTNFLNSNTRVISNNKIPS